MKLIQRYLILLIIFTPILNIFSQSQSVHLTLLDENNKKLEGLVKYRINEEGEWIDAVKITNGIYIIPDPETGVKFQKGTFIMFWIKVKGYQTQYDSIKLQGNGPINQKQVKLRKGPEVKRRLDVILHNLRTQKPMKAEVEMKISEKIGEKEDSLRSGKTTIEGKYSINDYFYNGQELVFEFNLGSNTPSIKQQIILSEVINKNINLYLLPPRKQAYWWTTGGITGAFLFFAVGAKIKSENDLNAFEENPKDRSKYDSAVGWNRASIIFGGAGVFGLGFIAHTLIKDKYLKNRYNLLIGDKANYSNISLSFQNGVGLVYNF